MPVIDTNDRDFRAPGEFSGGQDRSVAAQDNNHLGVANGSALADRESVAFQLVGHHRSRLLGIGPKFVGNDVDLACHPASFAQTLPKRPGAGPFITALWIASVISETGSGWSRRIDRKYSTFPAGPGSGEAATSAMESPNSSAHLATVPTVSSWWSGFGQPHRDRVVPCRSQTGASP